MRDYPQLSQPALKMTRIFLMSLFTTTMTLAMPTAFAGAIPGAVPLSPDVRQALDSVYLAAKEANKVHPIDEFKNQVATTKNDSSSDLAIKSSRDPIIQMIAVGLGVAAGMVIINYLSGGTSTSTSFSGFSTAMFGGMLGDYAYRKYYAPPLPSVPVGVAQRVTP